VVGPTVLTRRLLPSLRASATPAASAPAGGEGGGANGGEAEPQSGSGASTVMGRPRVVNVASVMHRFSELPEDPQATATTKCSLALGVLGVTSWNTPLQPCVPTGLAFHPYPRPSMACCQVCVVIWAPPVHPARAHSTGPAHNHPRRSFSCVTGGVVGPTATASTPTSFSASSCSVHLAAACRRQGNHH
jgi:hypothetical protein